MNSFKKDRLENIQFPPHITWLVGQCMEARGKQDLWYATKPELVKNLREMAEIQSAESSNRIEGVIVSKERLRPLLSGKSKPMDRPEEEVLGYKKTLEFIYKNYEDIILEPRIISKLHKISQGSGAGDGGKFKERDNEIIEILPNGERIIRFRPVAAIDTPKFTDQLCLAYRSELQSSRIPELILIASCVLDFLCIHPFRDGNGRVSRLLTNMLLLQSGYSVGRFISLEKSIEESKEEYYEVLKVVSKSWDEERHDILPWWNYFLSILRKAYREFEDRVKTHDQGGSKSELVRKTILTQEGKFTLSEIQALCPQVSNQLIRQVLTEMKSSGELVLSGKGRGAKWRVATRG